MNKETWNKILHYQLPPKIVKVFLSIILFLFSCLLFVCNAEAIAIVYDSFTPFTFWITTGFGACAYITFCVIFGILYCLFGNLFVSYIVLEILTIGMGIANRIVYFTRDQFITIAEFGLLGEAAAVEVDKGMFFHPIIIVLVVIGGINGLLVWRITKTAKKEKQTKQIKVKNWAQRAFVVVVLVVIFVVMHARQDGLVFDKILAHRNTGGVVWFCRSLFSNVTEDVSNEKVWEIYDNFAECVTADDTISEKRPNVIVIMSEGFWDVNNLDGVVEASENPMDHYYELVEDAVTGQVAVNIYGGGTNQSEFEFLTGISSRYLGNLYEKYFCKEQESLVSYMEELGYYSMAFHPYDKSFWNRDIGYSGMGFNVFYSDIDFQNKEMCHGYISDMSLTKEIIERFEAQKSVHPEQPIFSFAVSVQNHVSSMSGMDEASEKEGCTGITTKVIGKEIEKEISEDVEEHYNGMRETIRALEALMNYFEEYEEDTVIVFFGDHAPGFVKGVCDTEGRETEINLYRTPYMIWTNYENDYESYGDMSLPYLSSVLIEYLDLPKPNQYYMNKYMLEHYPINTSYEQVRLESLDEQRLIDMMSIISTLHKRFPKEEMAMPYWSIME